VRRKVTSGEHILRAGDRASQVFFVCTGLLREYYVDHDGTEATRRFCLAGDLTGSLSDLLSGKPALCSIEALEAGEVCCIDWALCDQLSERSLAWMRLLRRIAGVVFGVLVTGCVAGIYEWNLRRRK
jgi:CRP-like cAMP-binding protein